MAPVVTICCMGAGYVGGASMAVVASRCPDVHVLVVDIDAAKIDAWNSADLALPIMEPGLPELLAETRGRNLFFRTDIDACIAAAEIIFVCVDTPIKTSGLGAGSASDTSKCEDCARRIAQVARSRKIVVEKSTVPVRTADSLKEVLRANATSADVTFDVVSNPEFTSEGSAIAHLTRPDRVLIGGDPTPRGAAAVQRLVWLYEHWVPREKILTASVWSSELAKLVANAFLAQRISSINSISAICEATGANVHEVARAVGADDRIGPQFLQASLGFGGSSFQRDVLSLVYIAQTLNLPEVAAYWRRVVEINDYQKQRFVRKMLQVMYNSVTHKKICLFGFAYKKNTLDTRETAAGSVVRALLIEKAKIAIYDPYVREDDVRAELCRQGIDRDAVQSDVSFHSDPYDAAHGAHAIAVITECEELRRLDYNRVYDQMTKPAFFFDGRNVLPHKHLQSIGAEVHAIGQGILK
ncbi:hypothetical protein ATCC90586_000239 [Pythium insidiosum]|nr:hypothetical protein ATCC90586_000239 [Pythium insidiosum]